MKALHPHKLKGWNGIGGNHSAVNYSALRKGLSKPGSKAHKMKSPFK